MQIMINTLVTSHITYAHRPLVKDKYDAHNYELKLISNFEKELRASSTGRGFTTIVS